jgi:hypothetical protein
MARYGLVSLSYGRVRTPKPLLLQIRELCLDAEEMHLSDSERRLGMSNESLHPLTLNRIVVQNARKRIYRRYTLGFFAWKNMLLTYVMQCSDTRLQCAEHGSLYEEPV